MAINSTSFSNTPQAKDDLFILSEDTPASLAYIAYFDVMMNDLGGNAKSLYSIDNGVTNTTTTIIQGDLLSQDTARAEGTSSDTSFNGAKIWITNDGKVGYDSATLSATFLQQLQALNVGESLTDSFTYSIRLGNGTLSWATATIQFNGANDSPTLAAITPASIAENPLASTTTTSGLTGFFVGHDVDDPTSSLRYSVDGATDNGNGTVSKIGTYGVLTVNKVTGEYTFVPYDSVIEALNGGDHKHDDFTIKVTDPHGASSAAQTFTVNVTGANDAPTLAVVASGFITETAQSSATTSAGLSGTLVGADVDAGDTQTYGVQGGTVAAGVSTLVGTYGTLTVNTATGEYLFTPNAAAIEGLDDGVNPVLNFTMTVTDLDGATTSRTFSIQLTGADDAPTLDAVTSGSIAEVDQSSDTTTSNLTGTLVGHDVDAGDTLSYGIEGGAAGPGDTVSLAGTYGTLTVNTVTGEYTYVPNAAAIEALDDGDTDADVFTMTVFDGDGDPVTQTYTVNVTGSDDAPTLDAVTSGSVTEVDQSSDTTVSGLTGTLVGHDVDAGDTLSYGIEGGAAGPGDTVSLAGTYGTLTVNTVTGEYTYVPNAAAIEALDDGDTDADVFTMTVFDGDGDPVTQTYTVNVTGSDDAPTLDAVTSGSIAEVDQSSDTTTSNLTGTLVGHDVDAGDTLSYGIEGGIAGPGDTVSLAGTYGTLTVNTVTGEYTYVPNAAAIEALDNGDTDADVFTMTVFDGDGLPVTQTYTVNVTGSDDAPTLDAVTGGSVTEVDQSSSQIPVGLTGVLSANDVDGDTLEFGIDGGTVANGVATLEGTYGTLTVDTVTGVYTYTPNPAAIEALDDNENPVDSFTVTVSDGDGPPVTQTYAVALHGADDAPTLEPVAATIAEDVLSSSITSNNLTGFLDAADVDAGDTLTYGLDGGVSDGAGHVSVSTTYGVLTVTIATGEYSFAPNAAAIEALPDGATPQVTVGTTVSDGDGPLVASTFTLDLTGANDAPVAVSDTGSAGENEVKLFDVLANDTDVDTGDSKSLDSLGSVTVTSANGAIDGLDASSAFTKVGDQVQFDPGSLFDALAAGETATVTVNYTMQDNHGATSSSTLTVTVNGVNDAPVLTGDLQASMNEGDTYVLTTSDIGFTDVDDAASGVLFSVSDLTNGIVQVNGVNATTFTYAQLVGGLVTFVHDGSETVSAGFNVSVEDGDEDGSVAVPSAFTISVNPVNDAPDAAAATASVQTNEDVAVAITGLSVSDADSGAGPVTVTLAVGNGAVTVGGSPVDVVIDNNGTGLVTLTGTVAAVNAALGDVSYLGGSNYHGADQLTLTINDNGNSGSGGALDDSATVDITVLSVNDAPSGTDKTVATAEDTGYVFSVADFGFTDAADGDNLLAVKISTLPAAGTLLLSGGAISAGDVITAADIAAGHLTFAPAANANGAAYATFDFQVQDDGGAANGGVDLDPSANTITIDVTSVNDAPSGADKTVAALEDTAYTINAADFGFSDVDGNGLLAVKITTLPGAGTLTLNNVAVTAGQSVTVSDINGGLLKFTPAPNANGVGYANFTFQVQDDGGTANGGVDLDQSPNTLTFDVTSVNDAPAGTNKTVTTDEDTAYTITAADFGFTDPNDSPANTLLAVKITTLPGAGTLTLNGVAVTAGQSVTVANINSGLLKFTPAADANGVGYANFTFQVQDNGGTANGGVDLDQSPNTITVNVNPVNDAPVITSNGAGATAAVSVAENTTAVTTVTATDIDSGSLVYSIIGGADQNKFIINSATGVLSFVNAPDFETPTDAGGNNVYDVIVQVSDGAATDTQAIAVTVTDVVEGPTATSDVLLVSTSTLAKFSASVLLANDSGTHLEIISVSGSAAATFDYATQTLTFNAGNSVATTNLTYVLSDGTTTSSGSITVKTIDASATNVDLSINGPYQGAYIDAGNGGDTVTASGGFNILLGGNGQDILIGSTGNDILQGGSSNDDMDGGDGIDLVDFSDGNSGINFTLVQSSSFTTFSGDRYKNMEGVIGTNSNDTLTGSTSDDWLYGIGGNDTIDGGAGNDHIIGGLGKDTMTGGAGSDVFVFQTINDSSSVVGSADIITDFDALLDRIDVSQIDAQSPAPHTPFVFGGQSATLIAHGVTWVESGGNTIVSFDTDGNTTTAEMRIVLLGTNLGLNAGSFVF